MTTIRLTAMACLSFCLIAGCGGPSSDQPYLNSVSGKVTLSGKPVSSVRVSFTPNKGGRPASGETAEDGSFTLSYKEGVDGAPAGIHAVRLALVIAENEDYEAANNAGDDVDSNGLPKSAFDGSIQKEVKAGSNEINIEL